MMTIGGKEGRGRGWLLAAGVALVLGQAGPAAAERGSDRYEAGQRAAVATLAQAERTYGFDIPAKPLPQAIADFSAVTGVQVLYTEASTFDYTAPALSGTYTAKEALDRLLAGSGLVGRYTSADAVTVERPGQDDDGRLQLGPITVEAQSESAVGPVEGYVATRSLTGTKTNTPLIETPQSISIITRDLLDAQAADTLNDALRYSPGVTGEVFGNDSRVDFLQYRGFDENGTGVYRDGLQLRSTAFAEFRPELYGAQRVEVLRGPASVLYGQATPGGLVNVVTKRPPDELLAELELEAGSFDHREGKFDIGGPIAGNDKVLFRLTGLARDSETQVDFIDDDSLFIAPALTLRPWEDTTFTILTHYQEDRTGATNQFLPAVGTVLDNPNGTIPTDRFIGEPEFDTFDRDSLSLGYLFEHRFDETFTIRQNARYDYLDTVTETAFGGGLAADLRTLNRSAFTADGETDLYTIDTHVQANFSTGPAAHTLLFGIDYQRFDVDDFQRFGAAPTIDIFNPVYGATVARPAAFRDINIVQEQIGIYAQEQLKLYDDLVLTLGGRQDFVSSDQTNGLTDSKTEQDDSELSWRAGLVYLFDFGLAPYASYTESFLPVVGANALGEAFEPETGEQFEAGLKFQPPASNSSVTLAAFHLTRQNVQTADPNNPLNTIQTGEVRSRGIELEGIASFDFGLDVIASTSFQDVEITKSNRGDKGNRPTSVPEITAAIWADYTVQEGPLTGLGLGGGVRYKGFTYGDAANSLTVDDYVLVDAAIHYEWENLTFAINAENLLDNRHVAGCSSANACFYGTDRTVIGSVRFRW